MKARTTEFSWTIGVITIVSTITALPVRIQANESTFPSFVNFEGQPEGVIVDINGSVYVSVRASSDQLWEVSPSGETILLADLGEPGGGAGGLAIDAVGNIYMARAVANQGVYRISTDGSVNLLPGTEQIVFPNGLTFDQQESLYVTETFSAGSSIDSFGEGGIWRIPKGQTAQLWLRDELLTGLPPSLFPFPVGANGIGFYNGDIYAINTDKALIVRVPVQPDGSPGQPKMWKQVEDVPESPLHNSSSFPVLLDGLAIDANGNVYVAVISRNAIVRINARDRSQETTSIHPKVPLDAPASLAFGTDKAKPETLFVTNLGIFKDFIPDLPWPGPGLVTTNIQLTTGSNQSPVGTWVVSVEMPTGTMIMLESIQAQDLRGIHYGGVLKQVNVNPTHFGIFPDVDSGDELYVTQTVRTGPDSFSSTHLTYGTSKVENSQATAKVIVAVNTQWKMTGSDTVVGDGTASLYTVDQDADGDGFPDEDQTPTVCLQFALTGRRLHVLPLCEPSLMPES